MIHPTAILVLKTRHLYSLQERPQTARQTENILPSGDVNRTDPHFRFVAERGSIRSGSLKKDGKLWSG